MKKLFLFVPLILISFLGISQDTFSIVAVDSATGEVGSAGASCLDNNQFPGSGGARLISDVRPGRGVIHTQALYLASNQINAGILLNQGRSSQEIIDSLISNDAQNNPSVRQYGIADLDPITGSPRAAAFTGVNCMDYKSDIVEPYYAIQGNILLGQQILDSMETRFLNTQGTLAERLMAAMQGANVVGADTRCTNEGVSSLSAFLRVARPGDPNGNYYLDLNVPSTPFGVEPIDSLQSLFDDWLTTSSIQQDIFADMHVKVYPNPGQGNTVFELIEPVKGKTYSLHITNALGNSILSTGFAGNRLELSLGNRAKGLYFYEIMTDEVRIKSGKLILK